MELSEIIKLIGALGLFIYGMMVMSDGIQKLAGNRMRSILGSITSNRFKGIFTGFLTTTLIQSSSATTVMIVSFVNAGLLNLRQAIGVIMGANIGTTMTAWLLVLFGFSKFSLGNYVFPILAVGVPLLFVKRGNFKNFGEFLVGFGLLFFRPQRNERCCGWTQFRGESLVFKHDSLLKGARFYWNTHVGGSRNNSNRNCSI